MATMDILIETWTMKNYREINRSQVIYILLIVW